MKNKQAFTLIELLVVVLIIGILAAVALPQYQKAVIKSRASQLMTAATAVGRDAMAYKMASGENPTEFAQLSLEYDLPTKRAGVGVCGNSVSSTDASRENDMYQLIVNNYNYTGGRVSAINSSFITGPYKCVGFAYIVDDTGHNLVPGQLYCVELSSTAWPAFTPAGGFCEKIMKGTYVMDNSWRYYKLP
jgi:prepilin-type N-terminal cleavage/methylation domain-containing protein